MDALTPIGKELLTAKQLYTKDVLTWDEYQQIKTSIMQLWKSSIDGQKPPSARKV